MLVALVVSAFCSSILAGTTGAGGGVLLAALMSLLLPANVVVPLHGVVQLASNGSRISLLWRRANWRFVGVGAIGSFLGVLLVGSFALSLPERTMEIILGSGLLYLLWAPKVKFSTDFPGKPAVLAFIVSVVGMLIGPGGILVAAVRRRDGLSKEEVMADQAALMMAQNIFKISSFAFFGFAYADWAGLLAPMVAGSLLGTLVGVKLLRGMNEAWFGHVFQLAVTVIAGKLLVDGLMGY